MKEQTNHGTESYQSYELGHASQGGGVFLVYVVLYTGVAIRYAYIKLYQVK